FQLLRLVIGSSAVSLAILLATFMGGMFIGSLLYASIVADRRHPLRVYALLELGIGVIGLGLPAVLPVVGSVYADNVGFGYGGIAFRAGICGICMLPPTVLMGATLPAMARWVRGTPEGLSKLGFFYVSNLGGGAVGCLLAGFLLLPFLDVVAASVVAAAVNLCVAGAAIWLAARIPSAAPPTEPGATDLPEAPRPACAVVAASAQRRAVPVYIAISLSGMTALGAEVIWTRLLAIQLGVTVYTLAIILAVFLTGLAIGSGLGSVVIRTAERPRWLLARCQAMLVPLFPFAAFVICYGVPKWGVEVIESTGKMGLVFLVDALRCAAPILPATILWGASFPLALAALGTVDGDNARLAGRVYAFNTLGAVFGALLVGTWVIPNWESVGAHRLITLLAGTSALILFASHLPSLRQLIRPPDAATGQRLRREAKKPALAAAAVIVATGVMTLFVATPPDGLLARSRFPDEWDDAYDTLYRVEGLNAPVVVQLGNRMDRYLCIAGKVVASNEPKDMRNQRMLGHLPALIHGGPRSVLIVGLGAGVTAGSFVLYPEIERIVIVEIEPAVRDAAAKYFAAENHAVLDDPRVELLFDDARHYLMTSDETFDVITSDPIHPWVRGAAALFTVEFHRLSAAHLNPGGIVAQWVPLYDADEITVKSQLATFAREFPNATFWSDSGTTPDYDLVAIGSNDAATFDLAAIDRRLAANPRLKRALDDVSLGSAYGLAATYAGRATDLSPWLEGAEINRDRSMRLEYTAGLSLFLQHSKAIGRAIAQFRRYPEDFFVEVGEDEPRLRAALTPPSSSD
ncbi:MAG: fused MFS/spermidine synthase, partial [Myxococcota bacterium]